MRVTIDGPPHQYRPDQVQGLIFRPHNKLSETVLQFSKNSLNEKNINKKIAGDLFELQTVEAGDLTCSPYSLSPAGLVAAAC